MEGNKPEWHEGEDVLVICPDLVYEAKIISVGEKVYVGYKGWPDKFNEWVEPSRVLKPTEENHKLRHQLRMQNAEKKAVTSIIREEKDEAAGSEVVTMPEILDATLLMEEKAEQVQRENWGNETSCTFGEGYTSQTVYACKQCTASEKFGFCYACSLKCHVDHVVFELYEKRHFRCDCGTPRSGVVCAFGGGIKEANNEENKYNHNFEGLYCWCNEEYDGVSTMYQCCLCQDWFHPNCITKRANTENPMGDETSFDEFTCADCVERHAFLLHYQEHGKVQITQKEKKETTSCAEKGLKRKELAARPGDQEEGNKRRRVGLVMPVPESEEEKRDQKDGKKTCGAECKLEESKEATEQGSIFWKEGWRGALCRCPKCIPMYSDHGVTHLIEEGEQAEEEEEEEETATDAPTTSIMENALRAFLTAFPQQQQREMLHKFEELRLKLSEFLGEFAGSGKTVTTRDIQCFFGKLRTQS